MENKQLKENLRNSIVAVTFTKKNGEKRIMKSTLLPEFLPKRTGNYSGSKKKSNPNVAVVWDLEKNAWRSFRYDSVTNIKILEETWKIQKTLYRVRILISTAYSLMMKLVGSWPIKS